MAFAVDGLSGVVLAVLALVVAAGGGWRRWGVVAAAAISVVAADGVGLVLGVGVAAVVGGTGGDRRWVLGAAVLCLAVAVLALVGFEGFAVMRGHAPEGVRGALVLVAVLGTAGMLAVGVPWGIGGVLAVYVVARLLLDLPGLATPGWWGVPVLALGAGGAVRGAWRMAEARALEGAITQAGLAAQGVVVMGLGAALLARGADLQPLAALAVAGALLQLVACGLWGGLAAVCERAMRPMGGGELARLGGLLRRVPATGLALLVALTSIAALPATAGFAGAWMVLQGVLGAGRTGGTATVLVVAGGVSAWGLVWGLLAAGAIRVGGAVLLGGPRSAKAAAAMEPRRRVRLAIAAWAVGVLVLGLCPWLALMPLRPGVLLLSGVAAEGTGFWLVAGSGEGPGYMAPVIGVLMVAAMGLAGWIAGGPAARARAWQGGFAEDGAAIFGGGAPWSVPRGVDWGRVGVFVLFGVLGAALFGALGWAAR